MAKEVFLLEDRGRTALFAPILGLIMEVNKDEKERVVELINQQNFSVDDLTYVFPEVEKSRLLQKNFKEKESKESDGRFCPDHVVLFTTFDCNLRCIYCYAKGGEQKLNMSWETAKMAIDLVIENAKSKRLEEIFLHFHGGGEPTRNWPVFQSALDYFEWRAKNISLKPNISLATNGMLSKKRIEWIASRMKSVQVSLDGVADIQNFQRPTAKGGKSFAVVCSTIKSFLAKGVQITIHSVVTERGVNRIPEIVSFFVSSFPGAAVHLEPACECGRGVLTGQKFPLSELFIKGFIEGQKIAESVGVELHYSGATPDLADFHQSFCGVCLPNFVVMPNGLVTACHEVEEEKHPLASHFIYGHLDHQRKIFVLDESKIKKLRSYALEVSPDCQDCFARYCCAGDCLAKSLSGVSGKRSPLLNPRCELNRELTKHYIFKKLFAENKREKFDEVTSANSC